jgi:glycosidase
MKKQNILFFLLCLALFSCGQQSLNTEAENNNYSKPFDKVPDPRDVSIYQVNPRAFSKEGNLQGIIARLDSVQALGVNVLYLMPIYPIGEVRTVNSPYSIKDYTSVNKEFGTVEDLQALVKEAHARDMAVMLDWVANHTAYDHKWVSNKSWYLQDSAGNIISPPGTGWNDVAQLDFSNGDMRQEMIESMKYWVTTANVDGFRCDYADGPPFGFWEQAIDSLEAMDNRKLLLLAEGSRDDHFKAGFDYIFGFNFFHTLKEEVFGENKSAKLLQEVNQEEYAGAVNGEERTVRYISNHDVILDGTPLEVFGGEQGSLAAFIVAAYMKGVPMIHNGQEIGYPERLEFFSRTPIEWNAADGDMLPKYKKIISFYNSSEAIRRGELKDLSSNDVVVFTREVGDEKILVFSNLRNKAVNYTVPSELTQTSWEDAFSGANFTVEKEIALEPFEYLVLKN